LPATPSAAGTPARSRPAFRGPPVSGSVTELPPHGPTTPRSAHADTLLDHARPLVRLPPLCAVRHPLRPRTGEGVPLRAGERICALHSKRHVRQNSLRGPLGGRASGPVSGSLRRAVG